MHIYYIWICDKKGVAVYAHTDKAASPQQAAKEAGDIIAEARRVQPHLKSYKEIYIVIDCPVAIPRQKIPAKVFYLLACAYFGLSAAETNVMMLLLTEPDNAVIAASLNIAERTVETHRKNIYHKLVVHDLGSAISKIKEHALILMKNRNAE